MSQQPNIVYVQRPSNSMGVAGFIISLVGWVSCGILCPIGLVLSLIGLRKQPRGFAVAGVILGVLGTIWAVIALFFGGLAMLLACGGVVCGGIAPQVVTNVHIGATAKAVERFKREHGRLPVMIEELTGHAKRSHRDGWDRPLRLSIDDQGGFTITSDGPDGVPGNGDDVRHFHSEVTYQSK